MPFPTTGKLLFSGYSETPESAVLRTDMESGPPKQAKIKSRSLVTRPLTYRFNNTEYDAFELWFKTEINYGASWWNWEDPRDGATKQARIVSGQYAAKMAEQGEGAELEWDVSFNLETWG